jgi:hypothetical protein
VKQILEMFSARLAGRIADLVLMLVITLHVVPLRAQQSWACPSPPVGACVKRHGRLSSQNGIAVKLWIIGTKRVAVPLNLPDALPSEIRKYLDLTSENHSYIFGDFLICALEHDTPGQVGAVCVTGAEKLVAQPLNRPGQSFRIVSTRRPVTPKSK